MSDSRKRLVVYGAGGHAKVVADLAICLGYELIGFVDDRMPVGQIVLGAPVLGAGAWLEGKSGDVVVALGIGDNAARAANFETCRALGVVCPPLIHPRAVVAASASIGQGTTIMALAAVNPEARVGEGVIVNTGAIIEHECQVADFAHLSPNATLGGRARVGTFAHVGLCACVLPGIEVGERCKVGAGAVVNRNVGANLTVVGVPARPLSR